MKAYKTWEVIKMLTENPTLKFRKNYSCTIMQSEDGHIVDGNGEWVLVQEPVDFMTVVKSGKKIKVKHESIIIFGFEYPRALLSKLVDGCNNLEFKEILTEGKFYIEED